jgi:hypothetical protein
MVQWIGLTMRGKPIDSAFNGTFVKDTMAMVPVNVWCMTNSMKCQLLIAAFLASDIVSTTVQAVETSPQFSALMPTEAAFESGDAGLQRLHDAAVARLGENIVRFTPSMNVLVEGSGYMNAWLETQPMGGEMYAKRDVQTALNNQVIFMLGQRADGRLPGMVVSGETARKKGWDKSPPEGHVWVSEAGLLADFEMFQGFCFPEPAWRMYHWMGRDRNYLKKLHDSLAAHDAYLWHTRDSNGDGLLETWCVWDTGEDHSTRLMTRLAPNCWPFEQPPGAKGMPDPANPAHLGKYWQIGVSDPPQTLDQVMVPFESMDVMAYSYSARATLAMISAELGNGEETKWKRLAEEVRSRLIEKLWDPERHACFDIDRKGRRLPELIHNNLRCMWYGIFTNEMADAFIRHHLLNPLEFWTPVPLVSIAVGEPLYQNGRVNNWSGQPQGLTYQRAIGALERYGHFAEVTLLGQRLLPVLIRNGCKFPQQLDAVTGEPSGPRPDGYGPMALAALEYISRMHGIHLEVDRGRVWWSAVDADGHDFTCTQRWGEHRFRLVCKGGECQGFVGEQLAFTCSAGVRVVTDLEGKPLEVIGISQETRDVTLSTGAESRRLAVAPNAVITQ